MKAQCPDPGTVWSSVTTVQSFADERRRIAQDLGRCSTSGELIRSGLSLTPRLTVPGPVRWAVVVPGVDMTYNSALPFSLNDGPQWAGRGVTTTLGGEVSASRRIVCRSASPRILFFSRIGSFGILASPASDRSSFASPWHSGIESADLPLRFGNQSQTILYPGNSWIDMRAGPVSFGFSTDDQWWGPGTPQRARDEQQSRREFLRYTSPFGPTDLHATRRRWNSDGCSAGCLSHCSSTR